jgi:PAS domain S-box-containing protein
VNSDDQPTKSPPETAIPYSMLCESEHHYRELAENISDWIWEVDENIRYVYTSPKVTELLGYLPQEVLGKTPYDFMPAEEARRVRAGLEELLKNPHPFQALENINLHKDGSLRVLETSGIPLYDRRGRFSGLRGIDRDITERKKSEEAVRCLNENRRRQALELQATNRDLTAFGYSLSHDLRSPLTRIFLAAQTIVDLYGDRFDETGKGLLQAIYAGCKDMEEFIEAMLVLFRVTQDEINRSEVDLSALSEEIMAEFRLLQTERQVELVIAPGLVARCDPHLMRILLGNLLGNAWKYSSKLELSRIEVGCLAERGELIFFVRDNGAGFDMARGDRLFKPFQRLHSAQEFSGSGIGLATVQRAVERHGGRVWGEGVVDGGATFYFTLERPDAGSGSEAESPAPQSS